MTDDDHFWMKDIFVHVAIFDSSVKLRCAKWHKSENGAYPIRVLVDFGGKGRSKNIPHMFYMCPVCFLMSVTEIEMFEYDPVTGKRKWEGK